MVHGNSKNDGGPEAESVKIGEHLYNPMTE